MEDKEEALQLGVVAAVGDKLTSQGKLPELVADHVFRHEDGDEIATVVDQECVANKIRRDHRATRPGFDRTLAVGFVQFVDLSEKLLINERSFFEGSAHGLEKDKV